MYQSILEAMAPSLILDRNLRIVGSNNQIAGILGESEQELQQKTLPEYFSLEDESSWEEIINRVYGTEIPVDIKTIRFGWGDIIFYYNAHIALLPETDHVLITFFDICWHYEEMEMKDQFLFAKTGQAFDEGYSENASFVSHTIGNNITPINTSLNLIRDNTLSLCTRSLEKILEKLKKIKPEEMPKAILYIEGIKDLLQSQTEMISEETTRIAEHMEKVKETLEIESSYSRLKKHNKSTFELGEFVQKELKAYEHLLVKNDIFVEKNYIQDCYVELVQTGLSQVLRNVILNALDAMDVRQLKDNEYHSKELVITVARVNATAVLTVHDNGIGIKQEELNKIFVQGYSTKEKPSTIGLHNCSNYLIANDGSITASSNGHLQGSTFTITIPLKKHNFK